MGKGRYKHLYPTSLVKRKQAQEHTALNTWRELMSSSVVASYMLFKSKNDIGKHAAYLNYFHT